MLLDFFGFLLALQLIYRYLSGVVSYLTHSSVLSFSLALTSCCCLPDADLFAWFSFSLLLLLLCLFLLVDRLPWLYKPPALHACICVQACMYVCACMYKCVHMPALLLLLLQILLPACLVLCLLNFLYVCACVCMQLPLPA